MKFEVASLIVDGFALVAAAGAFLRATRLSRAAAIPPRSARLIIEIDGRRFIDIDSKLALAMLDCEYGAPIVNNYAVHGVQLRMTIMEGGAA